MASIQFDTGHNEFAKVTGNKTLAEGDVGVVQNVTATSTTTLPAAATGMTFPIRVGKEAITLTIATNGTEKVMGNGFTSAASKGMVFTNQPAGSHVVLVGLAGTGWYIQRVLGTATRQA